MTEAEKIKAVIAELQQKLDAIEAGYWVPEIMDRYYIVLACGSVDNFVWGDDEIDKQLLSMGNVYRTYEEAEHAVKVRKAYVKFSRMPGVKKFEPGTYNWAAVFDAAENVWKASSYMSYIYMFGIYFDSKQSCEAAIDAMGDEMELLRG